MNKQYIGLELDKIIKEVSQYTSFSLGREAVLQLQVDYNPLVIDRHLLQTKQGLEIVIHDGAIPFHGVKDTRIALQGAIKQRILTTRELLDIMDVNQAIQAIQKFMKSLDKPYTAILDLTNALNYYPEITVSINEAINQYGEIKDSASVELMNLRSKLIHTEKEITQTLNRFIKDNPDVLQESTISYRSDRACLLLKASYKNSYQGMQHGDTSTKLASYVEPGFLVPLNNQKQSLIEDINEEEKRILKALSALISPIGEAMLSDLETLGLLDAIMAKAQFGKKHNAIVAHMHTSKALLLKSARHPLIDPRVVVSNTYQLREDHHLLLITGSNTGGKTVSLKLIGLSVLMSYLGIPVLAEEAELPYFDELFEDITDDQSIIESLSTFSSHLKKLSHICRYATAKSLVLLDELGSGTDPKDGECLGIAILDHLRDLNALTICTTHYGRLKSYGESYPDILLGSVEFDQVLLQPTYRFIEGLVGQSNAFDIAKKFEFNPLIIEKAIQLKETSKTQDEHLIEELQTKISQQYAIQKELNILHSELQKAIETHNDQVEKFNVLKDEFINEAKFKANQYLEKKQLEAELLLEKLKDDSHLKLHEGLKIKKLLDDLLDEEIDNELIEPLAVGDFVVLKQTQQTGQIVDIGKKNIQILINGVKLYAKETDLRKTVKPVKQQIQKRQRKDFEVKTMSIECVLIGLTADEAREVMIKFIDEARVAQLKYVRIVHGHGQGILRKMVQDYLRSQSYVKSFEYALASDGGQGATVCYLN